MAHNNLLCLVISLNRSSDRRSEIASRLAALGLEFEFVDAVDASQGFTPQQEALIDRKQFYAKHGRRISNVEAACSLSHAKAYRRFLSCDAEHALIFEDDAQPTPALAEFLAADGHLRAPLISFYHSKARIFRRTPEEPIPGVNLHRLGMSPFGAVGYTLNRHAAHLLLAASTPVRDVADWPMDISELGACITLPKIVGHPPITTVNQSLLGDERSVATAERTGKYRRMFKKMLTGAYWKRKYRKALCKVVS